MFIDKRLGNGLSFGGIEIKKIDDNGELIFGNISPEEGYDGIVILKLNNEYKEKWMKVYWNGKNFCHFNGVVKDREGNYIIYGNISYKLWGFGNEIILIKVNGEGEVKYMQIFGVGNKWNEVKGMQLNDKGELIGLFEWSTKEDGEYKDYISIGKITVE